MLKKSNHKLLAMLALALIMCLSGITSVFAAGEPAPNLPDVTQAAITKLLQVPVGTDLPDATFTFNVEAVSVDGKTANKSEAPVIGTVRLEHFKANATLDSTDTDNTSTYYFESAGLFKAGDFPHAGVYEYTIKENPNTYTINDAKHETITYSGAEYKVKVYVVNDNGSLKISFIGAIEVKGDDGSATAEEDQDKLVVTPGGDPDANGKYSEMTFTNTYVHTNGPEDPDNPDVPGILSESDTLSISKTVTGEFGSETQEFTFTLTVNAPKLVADAANGAPIIYNAYVTDKDGAVGDGDPIPFTSGVPKEFKLTHGQKLIFFKTPVGTSYDVKESGTDGYEASVIVTSKGTPGDEVKGINIGAPVEVKSQLVSEKANSADFTNNRDDVTPTGLNLNDLPFYGLILIALGALTTFIVVKSRKRKYN